MGYTKEVNKDVYNYHTESHNTVSEYSEVYFEDIFNKVDISFGGSVDFLDYLVEDLGLNYIAIKGVEYLGLDTDDGSLYFNVRSNHTNYKNHKITPLEFQVDVDSSVSLEDVYSQDNDKLESKIEEELEISQSIINELIEERK